MCGGAGRSAGVVRVGRRHAAGRRRLQQASPGAAAGRRRRALDARVEDEVVQEPEHRARRCITHTLTQTPLEYYDTIRYDTKCNFNVQPKADMSQLNEQLYSSRRDREKKTNKNNIIIINAKYTIDMLD